jgi:hypothetical protein
MNVFIGIWNLSEKKESKKTLKISVLQIIFIIKTVKN